MNRQQEGCLAKWRAHSLEPAVLHDKLQRGGMWEIVAFKCIHYN